MGRRGAEEPGSCGKPRPGELTVGGHPPAGCCLGPAWGFACGPPALRRPQAWREAPPPVAAGPCCCPGAWARLSQSRSARRPQGLCGGRVRSPPPPGPLAPAPPPAWLLARVSSRPPHPAPPAAPRARHDVCDAMPPPMTLPPPECSLLPAFGHRSGSRANITRGPSAWHRLGLSSEAAEQWEGPGQSALGDSQERPPLPPAAGAGRGGEAAVRSPCPGTAGRWWAPPGWEVGVLASGALKASPGPLPAPVRWPCFAG